MDFILDKNTCEARVYTNSSKGAVRLQLAFPSHPTWSPSFISGYSPLAGFDQQLSLLLVAFLLVELLLVLILGVGTVITGHVNDIAPRQEGECPGGQPSKSLTRRFKCEIIKGCGVTDTVNLLAAMQGNKSN